ncbi:hypothetical protein ACFLU3_05255 [Chloroflexota bacterium]
MEGLRARIYMLLIEVVGEGRNVYNEEGKKQFFVGTLTDFYKSPETGTWEVVNGEEGKPVKSGWD